MDVYQAIRGRVAVREFKPDPVPDPVVRRILLAARWTPSRRNQQPWRFVVVRDREVLGKLGNLAPSGPYIAQAPMAIAVATEAGAKMAQFDAARAIENMELAAWAEGVGTCYVGQLERDRIKELLAIPPEMELVTVMPFGFPTERAASAGKRRKPLEQIAHNERFGRPYS